MFQQFMRQGLGVLQSLRNERLDPEQVSALQNQKLQKMLAHVAANSPLYQRKFRQAGVALADIQSIEDLGKLPVTTKQELRDAPLSEVLARGYTPENTVFEPTSGSSGKVLQVYHSPTAFDTYFSFVFRHLSSLGYRPWQRVAYTAFDPLVSLPWERLGLGVRQQVDLRTRDARSFLQQLLAINPQLITAFPSILLMIIRVATPAELRRIRPQAIHLHSELLTDGIRDTIRMAFDCDCFDDYSTIEFHHVATECRHHRYHTAADNVILEVVRDGQPVPAGEEGEIVITGLTNLAMPLIRYAIGDVGVAGVSERCACGSGFPTMQLVQGRVDDFIVLPSGRRLSPRIVNPAFEHFPGILEHMLIQETPDHVVAHLHVAEGYRDSLPQQVAGVLRALFAEPMRIEIMLDQDLDRGRTGKLRSIVSKVHRSASHLDQVPALHLNHDEVS